MARATTNGPPVLGREGGVRGLVTLFAVLGFVPLLVLAVSSVEVTTDAMHRQAERQVESSARATAAAVERQLTSLAELVESYADRPNLSDAMDGDTVDRSRVRSTLAELRRARDGIAVTFATNGDGVLLDVLPETPEIVGQGFAFRDWYRGVTRTGDAYVSEVYETRARGGGLVVAAAAPVREGGAATGRPLGILVAGYSLDTIQGFVDAFATSEGVSITITDQRGTVVADAGAAPTEMVSRRDDPAVVEALAGRSGVDDRVVDGTRVLQAHVPLDALGWTLAANVTRSDALAGTNDVRTTVTAVSLIVAIVMVVALTLLARALRQRAAVERQLRESEAALRLSEGRLALAIETAELGTWDWDVDADSFTWSSRVEEMLGPPPAGTLESWAAAVHPDDREAFTRAAREALELGRGYDIEFRVLDETTGERWVQARTRVVRDEAGDTHRMVGALTDVTTQRRAGEEMRRARREADEANRAKSEFLSRMSHELRTPLNAILGFSQLLEIDATSDEQRESIGQIARAGTHLLDLINEVLDISRIETGRIALSLEPVAMGDVVSEALDLVRPLAQPRGISLPRAPAPASLHVHADRQRVKQVLLNLLSNAVKYNRDGGSVEISYDRRPDGWVRIGVRDTGPGIPRELRSRLFMPFERLGAEQSAVEGTGLGLALSSRLVEAMGGRIGVDTEVGRGSTFWIDLIEAQPPVLDDEDISVPTGLGTSRANGRRVLYIEDNLSNVQLVERILGRLTDVELIVAMRAQQGLELARRQQPDVILLDLNLPDIDGETVLHRMRADPATREIPIVVVSADATPGQVARLRASGASDYLTKPFEIRRLLDALEIESAAPEPVVAADDRPARGDDVLRADAIAELKAIDERSGSIRKLVENYVRESRRQVEQVREALDQRDAHALEEVLHRMKGGSGMFGADRLLDVIATFRDLVSQGDLEAAAPVLDQLDAEQVVLAQALREEFPDRDGDA